MALVTEEDLNKTGRDRLLNMLQEKVPQYHPLIALLEMAGEDKVEDIIRYNCHKEIAAYIEPKLKSVEHKGSVKADFGTLRVVRSQKVVPVIGIDDPKQIESKHTQEELVFSPDNKPISRDRDLDEEIVEDNYAVNE